MEDTQKIKNLPSRVRKRERRIAYFSMEIGLDSQIPTYSGGLGILAGDTIRSCADLGVPLVAVTLLYKKGYFYQKLDKEGNQEELPSQWNPRRFLIPLRRKIAVVIEGRTVYIQAWEYKVVGIGGYQVPVFLLDTDIEPNDEFARSLSFYLYGGDQRYRLAQEIVLGIGGIRLLRELRFYRINRYHLNEGHASLLTLELLRQRKREGENWDLEGVRRMCVFTTHTPVPAGHDYFSYELVGQVLGEIVPFELLKELGGQDSLNMTLLALNLSHYINGVAKQHGKVSQEMFPGYHIDSITNGVHSLTWICEGFRQLYDKYIPGWANDPFSLRYALSIPKEEIWQAHMQAKKRLIDYVNEKTGIQMDYSTLTIGFARRATTYKRADLILRDLPRLLQIGEKTGKLQFIFAGKAHPQDWPAKEMIKKIISAAGQLQNNLKLVYLDNYDMDLAKMLVSGVDLWLNTPRKPQEASGTSGMKAAHNGVPSLSVLDGWWIEGCIEGLTGWSIGSAYDVESNDEKDASSLYDKLENIIVPMFYSQRERWIEVMRHCIAINASFFNTHRMVQQYVLNAYL